MCCITFLVKYILFFANLVFVLLGAGLVGLGIAVLVQTSDINDIIPVNINAIPITIIVLGVVVFCIAFCGCWGAIKQSKWLLLMYSICMGGLAAGKIYVAVVIFRELNNIRETVERWVVNAFNMSNNDPFRLLEVAFRCCGTTGPNSYNGSIPVSCCETVWDGQNICNPNDAFQRGCVDRLGSYFETFGDAIAYILIIVITIELVAMLFGVFLCCFGDNKKSNKKY